MPQDVRSQDCGDTEGLQKCKGDPFQGTVDSLNVTGEDKHVKDIMVARGMYMKEGAVAIMVSVFNGQVNGMKLVIKGGSFGSSVMLSQLVKGVDLKVTLKMTGNLEKLKCPEDLG